MKFLLDTNIWSYVANTDSLPDLLRASRKKNVQFQVAPALVNEARRSKDPKARKKLLGLMTNPQWKRLMPDTYLEAEEIRDAVLSARPAWKNLQPENRDFIRNRHSFLRKKGGFWDQSRDEVPLPITDESMREQFENEAAKEEVKYIRSIFKDENPREEKTHLQKVTLNVSTPILGNNTVDYWRHASAYHLLEELKVYASPYSEWLDCFIDVKMIYSNLDDFNKVWYQEIQPHQVKRKWLRTTMEYLQRWHKPTDGSPADSQIIVHAIDADYFVTADRNLARCLDKIHAEAPFVTAKPLLVPAGKLGINEFLEFSQK